MAESKKVSKFEELRRRAQSRRSERVDEFELFGTEDGFDPPIIVKRMPTKDMLTLTSEAESDPWGSYAKILGEDNLERISAELGDDLDIEALQELSDEVTERLYGAGAGDVPGGSQAS